MHRTSKSKGFFYLDHLSVDGKVGIVTNTYITPSNVHDSQPFIGCLARQLKRFSLPSSRLGWMQAILRPQFVT